MDAADAAGREHTDPGRVGCDHGRRDGRGAPAARGDRGTEAGAGDLAHRALGRGGQCLEIVRGQADQQPSIVERDGRGHGARGADRELGRRRDLEVLRVREPVADERRLERDDGARTAAATGSMARRSEIMA
jgi:hypothetical protein